MIVAFVPWDDSIKKNNIYTPKYEGYLDSHILLAKAFEKKGGKLQTVDMYNDLREVDCFLITALNYVWIDRILSLNLGNRMIYCSGEPAVVKPENSKEGYQRLLKIFPNIMTWNDDLIDNVRIFKKNLPYYFSKEFGNVAFAEKKLLTNISGNKKSSHKDELYSEREAIITYFENHYAGEFDLYGTGWKKKEHPSYQGVVDDKFEIYHHYKFALSLENCKNVRGYITEKMMDCFVAGIVPIYQGALDIKEYVPQECFIDYTQFKSIDELAQYLRTMREDEYNRYVDNIERFLQKHDERPFSEEVQCNYIYAVMEKGWKENVTVPIKYRIYFKYKIAEQKLDAGILSLKLYLKQHFKRKKEQV